MVDAASGDRLDAIDRADGELASHGRSEKLA